ncbi:alpha/beta hydrolase fold protein [Evansella cellulosilytica DSM 2522]|uniref:Alpha/beta hydrolase fold protein n=2 Tax=Evansella TaxID=2837485 RepID=E6TUW4_EVAC2|nr:alpha/beta hydrolase fold protein [Evansella cellulosilytica DSM 2522]
MHSSSLTGDQSATIQRQVVWKKNKSTLWHYRPKQKKYHTPLFLIYSLLNKPYILDLSQEMSMINAFTREGYDVYLLDFGALGYEDKELTLDDYIKKHIQKGVRRALLHSKASEITILGYCLGGTLAAIYAAIAEEPVKNVVLFAPPLDFKDSIVMKEWKRALKNKSLPVDALIDANEFIPVGAVKAWMKLFTAPITVSSYLSLLKRADEETYVKKWSSINNWANDHVPFSGAVLKKIMYDLYINNKLINDQLYIEKERVQLSNIQSSLLVVSALDDELVPPKMSKPLMDKSNSKDKLFKTVRGGHVTIAVKGSLPTFLINWLHERSSPISQIS